jgi:membrane protease subunit (stomatin/prohibitin family)
MAALRELTASKISITKANAEVLLTSFVSKGWLLKSAQVPVFEY